MAFVIYCTALGVAVSTNHHPFVAPCVSVAAPATWYRDMENAQMTMHVSNAEQSVMPDSVKKGVRAMQVLMVRMYSTVHTNNLEHNRTY